MSSHQQVCVSLLILFQELRNAHSEELMGIRREEEMEMSDDDFDDNPCKRMRTGENGTYVCFLSAFC